jgi:predicted SnoaL-like aldol condensation-catalyzing enzyme
MVQTLEDKNKAIVREAFDALFNRRDYARAEQLWAPEYIQHSAHIAPGRDGLFGLIKSLPDTLRHEMELIMAEGDMVVVRGRFSGHGRPASWIVVDTVRMEDGRLKEHWDVVEDEASRETSVSGLPMFGDTFPEESGSSPVPR